MKNFSDKFVQKIKRHILCTIVFFQNRGNTWYSQIGRRWEYNMAHALCVLDS